MRSALFLLALAQEDSTAADRVADWRSDLTLLAAEVERLHPDPFRSVSREEFLATGEALSARVPELDDDRLQVELMRWVASLAREGRNGHHLVWPRYWHVLPLHVYRFDDGWFVVATEDRPEWLGARLESVGELPVEELCAQIAPLLSRDNHSDLLANLAFPLMIPEVLHALGASPDRERAPLRLVLRDGTVVEETVEGQTARDFDSWGVMPPTRLPAQDEPRWLRRSNEPFEFEWLEEDNALLVRYTEVLARDSTGRTLESFADELVDTYSSQGFDRVVIDVRNNGGGDNTTFGPLIDAIARCTPLNQRGRLYALVGRATFSAAGNFVTALQKRTEVLLVGEPTGGAPNQYGDSVTVSLPNHPTLLQAD